LINITFSCKRNTAAVGDGVFIDVHTLLFAYPKAHTSLTLLTIILFLF